MTVVQTKPSRGFTLVELMVGLAVGLFVTLAAVSVFVSTRVLQKVNSSESRMGENMRLAMDMLQKDLRSADFLGCKSQLSEPPVSVLNPTDGIFLDNSYTGVYGAHGDGTALMPALNATLGGVPNPPKLDSDILSVRVPIEPFSSGLVAPMVTSSGDPNVGAGWAGTSAIQAGDIMLIANCKGSAMFQVTGNPSAGVLQHATGAGTPGNAVADLQQVFHGDSAVYRLQTHHYYVADSVAQPGTTSLWRYSFPNTDGSPVEVVQGVDRMVVTYGISNAADTQSVNQYANAWDVSRGVNSWPSVIAVRVQLLASTVKDNVTLSPQPASFAGGTVIPTDKRLRAQITEVVTLRNRAP